VLTSVRRAVGLIAGAWVGALFGTLYHPSQFDSVKATLNRNDPIMWLPQAVLVVDHQRCPLAFAVPPSVSKRRAQLEYLSSLLFFFSGCVTHHHSG